MAIITLTSDFGIKDHHIASTKGSILSELPDAIIIDVSHNISPFNIIETAYIVKNIIPSFPKNTVHIIAVDSEYSINNKLIAAKINDQYFITSNNGILSFLIDDYSKAKIFELNVIEDNNFYSTKSLIKAACHIARGGTLELIGKKTDTIKELKGMQPFISDDGEKIIGSVAYIDNYGNVVTNITRDFFNIAKGNSIDFEITARNHKWTKIQNKYNEIEDLNIDNRGMKDGQKLALFNSSGFLEIAIYRSNLETVGGASTLLGLNYRDSITINFIRK